MTYGYRKVRYRGIAPRKRLILAPNPPETLKTALTAAVIAQTVVPFKGSLVFLSLEDWQFSVSAP